MTARAITRLASLDCTLAPAREPAAVEVPSTLWLPLDELLEAVRESLKIHSRHVCSSGISFSVVLRDVERCAGTIIRKLHADTPVAASDRCYRVVGSGAFKN